MTERCEICGSELKTKEEKDSKICNSRLDSEERIVWELEELSGADLRIKEVKK